ncbi:MAG: hypothetical protein ACKVT2_00875 [Saprospiraceae bacterium]
MNKAFLFTNLLILTLVACKQDPKNASQENAQAGEQANPTVLAGHWIAMDFCAYANQYGSVLQAMNNSHLPYAYAITLNPAKPDSALCYNAFESWTLPMRYKADTLELMGARPGKSVFLIYNSKADKDITMIDPTGERVALSKFIKSKAGAADGYTAFSAALNHNLFNGVFTPLGKSAGSPVTFTPGGFLQGMKEFDRYKVCTGGDCFLAGQDIDVISFYNSKDKEKSNKFFGYKYNGQNDTLTIYNLLNSNPQEKGAYKVSAPAYRFSRKKAG